MRVAAAHGVQQLVRYMCVANGTCCRTLTTASTQNTIPECNNALLLLLLERLHRPSFEDNSDAGVDFTGVLLMASH
jgi:hypothetical protein